MQEKRILIIDDTPEIHSDFRKLLAAKSENSNLDDLEAAIFGTTEVPAAKNQPFYNLDSAYSGEEALTLVKKSIVDNKPYHLAFVDIRMPPGWNGVETIKHLSQADPDIQTVICTAYSDIEWSEISNTLDRGDNLLILKKPFDAIEVFQIASALTRKWELRNEVKFHIANLEELINKRTAELEKALALSRATLEATPEGIVAVDNDKNVLTYNKLFVTMWDIPEKMLTGSKIDTVFNFFAHVIEDQDTAVLTKDPAFAYVTPSRGIEIKLKSGKVFEYCAYPQLCQGEISGVVYSFKDITEKKRLEDLLIYQATHDNLTGLPNRKLLKERIAENIVYATEQNEIVVVGLIDLDHFKAINDSYGHATGDELLKEVGHQLKTALMDNATVGRLGGDEFVVILKLRSEEEIPHHIDRLLTAFAEPFSANGYQIVATPSVGFSIYPSFGMNAEALLKQADLALYSAKEKGRNTHVTYFETLSEFPLRRFQLLDSMRSGVKNNEFILYYQPIIGCDKKNIVGVEALLRWEHPKFGLLAPGSFIDIAEESGLLIEIGSWALKTACQQMKSWQAISSEPMYVAVNVSFIQLCKKDFVSIVKNALEESGLNPQLLELEITETLILEKRPDIIEKMHELKNVGVNLVIDDFGTGYTNIGYIKQFPFDKIKIDKSYVDNIASSKENKAIITAMISLSKNLDIKILAEGVETEEQHAILEDIAIDQLQGYFFHKPMPVSAFTNLLESTNVSLSAS